jgi:hypothetical protein
VVCPVCSGSGIKPKRDFELKWIKFWFDKDGNYVNMTGTDGKIRTQRTDKETYFDGDTNWSEDPNDYVKLRNLTRDELVNLPTGAYVLGNFDRGVIVARTYKSSSEPRKIYIIQNNQDGSEPNDNLWQRFGRFSWVVSQTGNEMSGNATLLIPKLKYEDIKRNDDQTEVNPYDWNNFLNMRNMRLDSDTDVKERIKDAHFAIVLDWLELKKSTFKPKEETSLQRASQRRGAVALKSDEEIKKANLNRYIEQITKNLEVKSDFGNMRTIISRFFGYEMAGWFILKGRKFDEFENFLNHLFRFLKNGNEHHYNYCIRYYKESMQSNIGYISELKKTLDSVRNQSKTFQDGRLSECYQKLEELADLVKTNVNQFKIETYEDLETFYQSIKSVRELMYSDRYKLRNVYRALENIRVGEPRTFYYYFEDIDEPKETAEDLDRYKAFVNRMLK